MFTETCNHTYARIFHKSVLSSLLVAIFWTSMPQFVLFSLECSILYKTKTLGSDLFFDFTPLVCCGLRLRHCLRSSLGGSYWSSKSILDIYFFLFSAFEYLITFSLIQYYFFHGSELCFIYNAYWLNLKF